MRPGGRSSNSGWPRPALNDLSTTYEPVLAAISHPSLIMPMSEQKKNEQEKEQTAESPPVAEPEPTPPSDAPQRPKEIGGPPGPEPTRYGDWQYKGRVTDF